MAIDQLGAILADIGVKFADLITLTPRQICDLYFRRRDKIGKILFDDQDVRVSPREEHRRYMYSLGITDPKYVSDHFRAGNKDVTEEQSLMAADAEFTNEWEGFANGNS